jgi:hypothetical protein
MVPPLVKFALFLSVIYLLGEIARRIPEPWRSYVANEESPEN